MPAVPTQLQNIEVVKIPDGFLKAPRWVNEVVLAAGVAKQMTVPVVGGTAYAHFACFSADCDFRVGYNTTAAISAGDVTDGSGSELNPDQRYLLGITTISLISPTGGRVTVSFYRT